jgi:hypothetical protein
MRLPGGGEGELGCTAVLVAPDLALTAQHCVPGRYGVQAVAATLELGAPGESAGFPVAVAPMEASAELDYSLLRVEGRPGERYGWARLAARPARQDETLFVVHFPHGRAPMLTRRDCRVHRGTRTDFIHSCDTSWGSSGAPLFSQSDFAVVGLHIAGSSQANYGKQAAALLAASPALAALAGAEHSAVARRESTAIGEEAAMAEAAERLVARNMRNALEAFAAMAVRNAAPKETIAPRVPERGVPEPYLRWDSQSERPGPSR